MILYSNGCPKCEVLKKKLDQKSISFTIEENDFSKLLNAGITRMPVLEINNELLDFEKAIKYVDSK